MTKSFAHTIVGCATAIGLAACSPSGSGTTERQPAGEPAADQSAAPPARLLNMVCGISDPPGRAPGSFYIFLADGTLVMTSCVETYRLATWRAETVTSLSIVEDQIVRYTAEILEVTDREIRLRLDLRNEETVLPLEPAQVPYVCPDLRREGVPAEEVS